MKKNERISSINSVLQDYFTKHPQSEMTLAKEFMHLFIKNGIFNKDYKEGLPIRKILRAFGKSSVSCPLKPSDSAPLK
ncbi:hypothetical protein DWY55_18185, partial [Bacteroides sp. AF25-38AC]